MVSGENSGLVIVSPGVGITNLAPVAPESDDTMSVRFRHRRFDSRKEKKNMAIKLSKEAIAAVKAWAKLKKVSESEAAAFLLLQGYAKKKAEQKWVASQKKASKSKAKKKTAKVAKKAKVTAKLPKKSAKKSAAKAKSKSPNVAALEAARKRKAASQKAAARLKSKREVEKQEAALSAATKRAERAVESVSEASSNGVGIETAANTAVAAE
jgi:hypothetical protein